MTGLISVQTCLYKYCFTDSIQKEQQSSMLQRLLGHGSYESFEMRCFVSGQSGTGKSSLIALLVGDTIPERRHLNDGFSLQESRCGLDLETRNWIHINPGLNKNTDNYFQVRVKHLLCKLTWLDVSCELLPSLCIRICLA